MNIHDDVSRIVFTDNPILSPIVVAYEQSRMLLVFEAFERHCCLVKSWWERGVVERSRGMYVLKEGARLSRV